MTIEELEKFSDHWIGSCFLQDGKLKRQINFLGSIKEHKQSFLKASKKLIENTANNED